MPKMKTRKSIAKRLKVTGKGKLLHGSSMSNHLKMSKSKKQIKRYKSLSELIGKDARKFKKLILS